MLSPALTPFLTVECRRGPACATALAVLTLGALSAEAAPPPGPIRIEGRDNVGLTNTLRNRLAQAGDQDVRRFNLLANSREAVAWRPLDGAGATGPRNAPVASRDPPADVARLVMRVQLNPLTDQWTNPPNWVQTLGSVRRQGIPLLRPSSHSRMVLSFGSSRRGVAGIYLVQNIAP